MLEEESLLTLARIDHFKKGENKEKLDKEKR